MDEIDEFTMSGKTIDLLRKEVVDLLKHGHKDMNDQIFGELVNLGEALKSPNGFRVTFEFHYNS